MDANKLKNILEAGLLVAGRTLSLAQLEALFQSDSDKPERKAIKAALESLKEDYAGRGIELVEVASGYRLQSHSSVADWVANLFQEKQPRYSRALLETLVLIAYRQPITRAEIEEVRGVAVSSNIIKTLQERQWVKVLGHKEVPGRPALLGTSKEFLDYFNLKKLDELPALADIKDLDQFDELLADELGEGDEAANDPESEAQTNDDSESSSSASGHNQENDSDSGESSDNQSDDEGSASMEAEAGQDSEEQGDVDQAEREAGDDEPDDELGDELVDQERLNQTMSSAEMDLLQTISDFSEEHQKEIAVRDEMEKGIVKTDDADEQQIADLSQRVGEEHSGDLPEPGDTLH